MSKQRLIPTLLLALAAVVRAVPDRDAARELDRDYERVAHEALVRYFDDGTFLVRASVELLDDDELPANRTEPRMGSLPGLPAGTQLGPTQQDMVASVQLDILVDTTYTARDRDFIQYLVTLSADLDTGRGDEVLVRRAVFPRDNRAVGPHRKPDGWKDPVQPGAPAPRDTTRPAATAPATPPDLSQQVTERVLGLLPLLVVCVTALLCAWLLGRAILASRGDTEERILSRLTAWRRRRKEEDEPRPAISLPEPRPAAPPPAAASAAPAPQPDPSVRPALLEAFVGDPRLSGQILRNWILRDNRKGIRATAAVLSGTDPHLLDMVRDALGTEAARAVDSSLAESESIPADETTAASQLFLRDFRKASSRQSESKEGDLFGFLDQLNEAQIAHVLKGESAGVAGFALTQISPDKTSSILSKVDPAARAKLLVGMGNVSQIPREVYREMADRLSLKALEASNLQYVTADGVDSLLKIIDTLPLDEQFGYIHSISEIDIHLARRLRERTITFSELGTLPDRFLAPRLQSLDPDDLALALLRAEQELRDRLLSLLPERQRMMLQSTMESRHQATREELDAAARRLLKTVRDEIRRQGRPQ